jgi:hypothetical protein
MMTLTAKDILGVASDSLARFGDAIIGTLGSPALAFAPAQGDDTVRSKIPSDAMAFAVLSAVIGTALGTMYSGIAVTREALVTDGITILVILSCWLAFGLIFHQVALRLGASGAPATSISIVLQTLGSAYFAAHVLLFVTSRILLSFADKEVAVTVGVQVFILSQTLIIARTLGRLTEICHSITRDRAQAFGWIMAIIFSILNFAVFIAAYLVSYFSQNPISFKTS